MKNEKAVSIYEAAEKLGVSEQFLRCGLRAGKFPFGEAIDMSGKGRYTYYINRARFDGWRRANVMK